MDFWQSNPAYEIENYLKMDAIMNKNEF